MAPHCAGPFKALRGNVSDAGTAKLASGKVSKNKKKKLLRKTTESCLAVTSHSNSGADILDVADWLERTKLEEASKVSKVSQ